MSTDEVRKKPWWPYLDSLQQDLVLQSLDLVDQEEIQPKIRSDYSYLVFPMAKAYEGFLKKFFFDLGLITRNQFSGERFRIGRALNPSLYKDYPRESVYEKLARFCGGEEISDKLWRTWKNSRNSIFHYFPDRENLISFGEAKNRVDQILEAIDFSFRGCRLAERRVSFKEKVFRRTLSLYLVVFVIWSFFRFAFRLPILVEELLIKPLLWLGPTVYLIKKIEKRPVLRSLGYGGKNFEVSLFFIGGFLVFFFVENLILGYLRFQNSLLFQFFSLPISSLERVLVFIFAALVEETLFRGYLFNRLWEALGKAWKANLIVSLGFVLIHLPISVFVYQLAPLQIFVSFLLILIMSLGSGLVYSLAYNPLPSVVWHFLWNWQMILGL